MIHLVTTDLAGIRYSIDEHRVGWLTIDRPDAGNAISVHSRARMIEIFRDAGSQLEVGCIVVSAVGERHFCSGGDLRVQAPATYPPGAPDRPVGEIRRRLESSAQVLIGAILDCDVPVLASVNGTAAGLGTHLAFACDLVIAAEDARFIEAFPRRGLVPDAGGSYLLPRLVGVQRAKRLLLLDEQLTAAEAHRIGLVSEVVPREELRPETERWAQRIASGPTAALGFTRKLINQSLDEGRESAFAREAAAVELNSYTHDATEGVAAFLERRPPSFRGW